MIDLALWEKYFLAKLLNKMLDFHFTALHRHIIGIRCSGNSVGQMQTKVTRLISIEKVQNLCSNSSYECILSKTPWLRLKIPYRSKAIVETVTVGHFSIHFLSDYGSRITSH